VLRGSVGGVSAGRHGLAVLLLRVLVRRLKMTSSSVRRFGLR
jgi:hypothetical protein